MALVGNVAFHPKWKRAFFIQNHTVMASSGQRGFTSNA